MRTPQHLLALTLGLFVASAWSAQGATCPRIYLASTGDPVTQQLYADGAPPLRLSCAMQVNGNVLSFAVAPDCSRVIYVADATRDQIYDLWSVPITGGTCVMVSNRYAPGTRDYDVRAVVQVSLDSTRAVYVWGWSSGGSWEMWSAPIAAANSVARISQPGRVGRGPRDDWSLISEARVRYASDVETDETFRWYVVPIIGGRILREIFSDGFNNGSKGAWQ